MSLSADGLALLRQLVEIGTAFQSCGPSEMLISDGIFERRYDKGLAVIVNP